ncbi:hypothetical protein FLAG1_07333 [Fusarium langsethiae]|uniref:Uncharacterized protein n=1 Tax=Fusarium langsethiae TaxID=179993 RepID=A0A0N0V645_FUSLA|nr:hypothetical protein FLAG1_07333 [Fusarium langsethiae]
MSSCLYLKVNLSNSSESSAGWRYPGRRREYGKVLNLLGACRAQRQDNVNDLWQFVSNLERDEHGLHQRLLRTGATIVWKDNARPLRSTDEKGYAPILEDVDTIYSQVATIFAILYHLPSAFVLILRVPISQRSSYRGFYHATITQKDTKSEIKDWPGFVRPAVVLDGEDDETVDSGVLRSLEVEHALLGGNWLGNTAGGGKQLALQADIIDNFREEVTDKLDFSPNNGMVQGRLALSYLPAKELKFFCEILLKRAHIAYNQSLSRAKMETLYSADDSMDAKYYLVA